MSAGAGAARPILPGATIGIFGGGQLGPHDGDGGAGDGISHPRARSGPGVSGAVCGGRVPRGGLGRRARGGEPGAGMRCGDAGDRADLAGQHGCGSELCAGAAGRAMLAIMQDRIEQKDWLRRNGFPVGEYRAVRSLEELREAIVALGGRCFCKSATGGYDGRGQGKVGFHGRRGLREAEVRGAWEALGESEGVVEQAIDLEREISVLVARSPSGEVKVYPAAWNHHENQILAWSVIPAPIPACMEAEAQTDRRGDCRAFQLEGLLAVEMFVTQGRPAAGE